VLKRWYGVDALVSYVAIPGEAETGGNSNGPILMVTDNKNAGAADIARGIAALMPNRMIEIVNAYEQYVEPNITALPYERDMNERYRKASVLINPIYNHDGCGTGRTMMEAMRFGLPVVGTDRAGLMETGGVSVSRNASPEDWASTILKILSDYPGFQAEARSSFAGHDATAELDVYVNQVKRLIK
ncbi:MAG: glycosyltransferase family 4 protein, partial [Candidatus Brocadiales bacterium]|nr:glycosyltransferase family 4 protein [Candidatus Bathyanammoxibius sp.]